MKHLGPASTSCLEYSLRAYRPPPVRQETWVQEPYCLVCIVQAFSFFSFSYKPHFITTGRISGRSAKYRSAWHTKLTIGEEKLLGQQGYCSYSMANTANENASQNQLNQADKVSL